MVQHKEAQELWASALDVLQLEVTRSTYETWLRGTQALWGPAGELVIATPNPFVASWLEKRMYSLVRRTVEQVAKVPLEVRFQVDGRLETAPPSPGRNGHREPPQTPAAPRAGHPGGLLSERYTFASFVVGKSNQLAHAAAQAVAEFPGRRYNPLFIYSDVGLGKTHLLHAIGHRLREQGLDVLYGSTEQFTNEFIKAIREGTTEAFRNKYRSVDALLMDDIQFLSGKEQTQEGFFHTFNELHNANHQIVLTSDRPPKALSPLEDRLRSRFEWGLIADMQPPDLETRIAILQQKVATTDVLVPYEVIDYLARKVMKNIRELEGSLNRVLAYASLTNQPISSELASETLADLRSGAGPAPLPPGQIIATVASFYRLDPSALAGSRRDKEIALARHIAMYLLKEDALLQVTEIGRLLGGRDHSTVINGCGKIAYQINVDPELRRTVIALRDALREPTPQLHPSKELNPLPSR